MVQADGDWADEYHLMVRTTAHQQAHARALYEDLGFRTDGNREARLFPPGAGKRYLRVTADTLRQKIRARLAQQSDTARDGWEWHHVAEGTGMRGGEGKWIRTTYEMVHSRRNGGDGRPWEDHEHEAAHIRGVWTLAHAAMHVHDGEEAGERTGDAPVRGQGMQTSEGNATRGDGAAHTQGAVASDTANAGPADVSAPAAVQIGDNATRTVQERRPTTATPTATTGATSPNMITHCFVLKGHDLVWAMLEGERRATTGDIQASKDVENRHFGMAPGWYGVILGTNKAPREQYEDSKGKLPGMDMPTWGSAAAQRHKGKVVGVVKISHALPVTACTSVWAMGPVCNVIERAGWIETPVACRGNFGACPIQSETARQHVRQQADIAWRAGSLHLTGALEKYPRTGGRQSTMSAWVDSANEALGGSDADLHTSAGGDTPVAAAVAVPGRPRRRNEHAHGQDTTTRNQMQGTHTKETNGTSETRQKEAGKAQRHSRMDDSR